ncbi:CAAX amino terminal protease family protein [Euphorbia peplus]|nr:CAAX amino terminal protease family protein [Euphorbia peplus]
MRLFTQFSCQYCNGKLTVVNDSINFLPPKSTTDRRVRVFARRKSEKKLRGNRESENQMVKTQDFKDESRVLSDGFSSDSDKVTQESDSVVPSRNAVLQACVFTSGLIAAVGIVVRQVSHVASTKGLPILDCSTQVSFSFETWHLELIAGTVILISSTRYLLLKTWPDFAGSSEAANQQVLTSLEPLDYILVSFLPGISEELLFRGTLLPLFGMDWKSALASASVFGILHLGSGRKYSFAIWATFVGLVYGYTAIVTSSIVVPMASHALNNLIGGILWRSTSKSSTNSVE